MFDLQSIESEILIVTLRAVIKEFNTLAAGEMQELLILSLFFTVLNLFLHCSYSVLLHLASVLGNKIFLVLQLSSCLYS